MLATSAYVPTLVKKIVSKGSTITHLEKFDLSPLITRIGQREPRTSCQRNSLFKIQKAAYAAAQSDNLMVVVRYNELMPVTRWSLFEEKVQESARS